jgi:uncharacterized membrane protein YtjA (UPF0391 family)
MVAYEADKQMLRLAVLFLVLGLIAGLLGFTGIAGASFAVAKLLFGVFLLIFLVLLVLGMGIFRSAG